ncbi:hypothetical protein ONZ51_g2467 [Trametes cubensis]|uniref:Uncharacterized protein n=1 Tax=Trametes cubensis TaxID=1111947 RepID=A0AAD7U0M6_9APHY|nr:hypothetical protein ONZ51_g2467 [Trametes cubensis]
MSSGRRTALFLALHLALSALKLLRAECASRLDVLSCSIVHSIYPFVSFALGALGVALALNSAKGALGRGLARARAGDDVRATWQFVLMGWEVGGSPQGEDSTYMRREPTTSAEHWQMPGAWDWSESDAHADHRERYPREDAEDMQPKLPACPRKRPRASVVDVPESDTDVDFTLCTSHSGDSGELDREPAADGTSTTAPHTSAEVRDSAGAIDSSEHQDVLTLLAEDMDLLGRHLARTYGMFAWRVHPLIRFPTKEAYPGGVEMGLFQRIDAFTKPVGRVVHYVEVLVEWVPSSCSDFRFFARHAATAASQSRERASGDVHGELRIVGVRVHAFRARRCDPHATGRAEFFLNMLGLGSQWACSWGWDMPLGAMFDGPECARRALDHAIIERWNGDVREYWVNAGRTLEEVEGWAREVEGFGWADVWDSDSDGSFDEEEDEWSDDWTDEGDVECNSGVDLNFEFEFCEERYDEDEDEEQIFLVFSSVNVVVDAAQQFEPCPQSPLKPTTQCSQDAPLGSQPGGEVMDEAADEPEDVVLYPRSSGSRARELENEDSDDDELILYQVPHTEFAVYPPTLRTTPLEDPLTELQPVFAPIPAHAAGVPLANGPVPSALPMLPLGNGTGGNQRPLLESPSVSSDDEDNEDDDDQRLVLYNRTGHQVAFAGNGLIRMIHTLILENTPGPSNGRVSLRRAAFTSSNRPLPSPASLAEVCEQLEALAEAEDQAKKKRTRRAGKRVTKRRQREREERVVRTAQLAGELLREAHIVADEVGMVLVDIEVNVAV